jgi:hypothetical protein
MQRKLTINEIINLSNESIIENLNNTDSFDSETILMNYAESQLREITLSPDLLFKLLDYTSKVGWEDLNVEILNFVKAKGSESYSELREKSKKEEMPKVSIPEGTNVPITPLVSPSSNESQNGNDITNKQIVEILETISQSGDSLSKVFGSLIGQLCSFIGFVILTALIDEMSSSRSRREYEENVTGIYVLISLFFLIRMLVFLSRSSNKLKNIKFTVSRH